MSTSSPAGRVHKEHGASAGWCCFEQFDKTFLGDVAALSCQNSCGPTWTFLASGLIRNGLSQNGYSVVYHHVL